MLPLPAQIQVATITDARVVAVEPGSISIRLKDDTVIACKVQDVGDNGVAIGGVAINAPVDATVSGSLPLRLAEKGMLLKCRARLNLNGKIESPVSVFQHLPQSVPPLKTHVDFFERPKTNEDFADCEIVGRVITVNHDVVSLAVPAAKWARRRKVNVPINSQSRFNIAQPFLKNIQSGDVVDSMEVREFENGERLIKRIAASFSPTREQLTIREADRLAQEFAHLSKAPADPRVLKSDHFILHTDASDHQSQMLLARLENMFTALSRYFSKRPSSPIQCYVVEDIEKWANKLPPVAAAKIDQRSGVTIVTDGDPMTKGKVSGIVYSCNDHRIVQHESVHAFCVQTFGGLGPVWYAEGIAEVGLYFKPDAEGSHKGLQIDPVVIEYLRSTPAPTIAEIISDQQTTGDSWQQYAWRWAMCHFLSFNQNYRSRFRRMSVELMTDAALKKSDQTLMKSDPTAAKHFDHTFVRMRAEMDFEFAQFVANLNNGLDANAIRINWALTPKPLTQSQVVSHAIRSDRGWQPVGVEVKKGQVYDLASRGEWKTEAGRDAKDPRLQVCVLSQVDGRFEIGDPIKFSRKGELTADADGQLLLRCDEDLSRLSDNEGKIEVFVRRAK